MKGIIINNDGSLHLEGIGCELALKEGVQYLAEIRRPRSLKQLKMYWAMISYVFDSQEVYQTEEELSDHLKIMAGFCHRFEAPDGIIVCRPHSLSFESMKQHRFNEYMDIFIGFIMRSVLPTAKPGVRLELERMVGLNYA